MKYDMSRFAGIKYFAIFSLLLLAASCEKQPAIQSPVPTSGGDVNQGINKYTSPNQYGFSFGYSEDFGFTTDINQVRPLTYIPVCDEKMLACAFLKRETYPQTNFDGAGVSINIYPEFNTEQKCYQLISETSSVHQIESDVILNGVTFKHGIGGGAATGHSESVKVYRNFRNNQCYEIAAHIAETNIGMYEPGTIKPFDDAAVWEKLNKVVNSFIFTK